MNKRRVEGKRKQDDRIKLEYIWKGKEFSLISSNVLFSSNC